MPNIPTKVCIVVPCYNEQEILKQSVDSLQALLGELMRDGIADADSFIALVDDGSSDRTWVLMEELKTTYDSNLRAIKLSRNHGHQSALLTGLLVFGNDVDCTISIDADLQDDILVMKDMLVLYKQGFDVVYGVRNQRKSDTFFKRFTAEFFYKLMLFLGVKIVYNHADYRLASSRVIKVLGDFKEVNLFLRGIFPLIGFKSAEVYYDRKERTAGESKYPIRKMLSFAWDGITSFSVQPLRFIFYAGLIIFLWSLIYLIYILYVYLENNVIRGWTSLATSLYFMGSIQLMAIGIIGEYIGKIYSETKQRPRFTIDRII